MSYDLTAISFFQFDNLVQNRIPFVFLHDGVETSALYALSTDRHHLEKWAFTVDFTGAPLDVKALIAEKGLPPSVPVVLASKSGAPPRTWADDVERQGFMNVHAVDRSWDALVTEARESR